MENEEKKDAAEKAAEMMRKTMGELPTLAIEYCRYLSKKVGYCMETCMTAYAHYCQAVLGMKCGNELYAIDDPGKRWFEENWAEYA